MLNEFRFIRVYKALANGKAETTELLKLYDDLQAILGEDTPFAKWFKEDSPDRLGAAIAIDAVAHAIHAGGNEVLQQVFPDAEYSIVKEELDKLAGLEKNSQIRQYNRGYFTTFLADDAVFLIEKELTQVGRTTREAILPAIKEYEKLYKAGLSSPAELLTLSRYYPDNEQYRATILKLGLDNEDNHPIVVGGPASVEMIDREGHLITTEALDNAFTKFMANFRGRNLHILHSDVKVGWILPAYMTKDLRCFSSGVDDKQLWVLGEIRGDTRIAKRVAQEVLDHNLRSYSIAGSALDVQDMQKGANSYKEVREMEMSEITLCLVPETKIWTKDGLKEIKDIQVGDLVYTHKNRWRSVTHKFERQIDEDIVKVTIEDRRTLMLTCNHSVRAWTFGGQHTGSYYSWIFADQLKIGQMVSSHIEYGKCDFCKSPLFKKLKKDMRNFCNEICKYSAVGNKKGYTKINGDKWAIELGRRREKQYKDPEFTNKHFAMLHQNRLNSGASSNKLESDFDEFLSKNFGGEWKYVGNGEVVLGGRNPDFININGKKKIIEIFGDYWHKDDDPEIRIRHFKQYGYDTLVIWEKEFRSDKNKVLEVLKEFVGNSWSKIINIEKISYNGKVFNLEVEEDHSYATEAMVVKNCERGMNSQANFDLIKSESIMPTLDSILSSFKDELSPFSGAQIYVENSGEVPSVIIKADKYNSIIDMLVLELQKMLPENTPVIVKYDVSDAIPVYKMQLVPIWSTPQIQVEATHSFPAKLGENVKKSDYEKYCDFGSNSINRFVKAHSNFDSKEFLEYVTVHNKADRDSGELGDIAMSEIERLSKEFKNLSDKEKVKYLQKSISYEEETERINESKKTEKAKNPHKFVAAEWTHKNGHPRCKICSMEEGMDKMCPGLNKLEKGFFTEAEVRRAAREKLQDEGEIQMGKATRLFKEWLKKENKELDSPGKRMLLDYNGRNKHLRELLTEQGMPEDIEPKEKDSLRDNPEPETNSQPWITNESGMKEDELSAEEKAKARGKHKIERFDN